MATLKISDELKNVIKQVIADTYFPVGALYASFNNVDPNNFLLGTWERISGAYLMAGDPNSTMEHKNIGGAVGLGWNKTTGSTILTIDQIPPHSHYYHGHYGYNREAASTLGWNLGDTDYNDYHVSTTGGGKGHDHSLPNYPAPTIVLNVWRRTA